MYACARPILFFINICFFLLLLLFFCLFYISTFLSFAFVFFSFSLPHFSSSFSSCFFFLFPIFSFFPLLFICNFFVDLSITSIIVSLKLKTTELTGKLWFSQLSISQSRSSSQISDFSNQIFWYIENKRYQSLEKNKTQNVKKNGKYVQTIFLIQ